MLLDDFDLRKEKGIEYVKNAVRLSFNDKINLVSENKNFDHHGWFKIEFLYSPCNYSIIFENEFSTFSVRIENMGGEFTSLFKICPHDNEFTSKNLLSALTLLETVLEDNEIEFVKIRNEKLNSEAEQVYKKQL